eukprot:TRINITY_DN1304_c0_g2_i1.p1 TRINITY_DN1304_c0_g2~~TRINITY_DN1304_c0_g2_i1.p1  ORF type:complete len:221 (-),score=52.54 TRINITY_DN1304_c0_g2_i1:151-813(-)
MGKRSKRSKVISLTKTKKKGRDHRAELIQKVRGLLDKYYNCFVFSHQNMTTTPFRDLQLEWKDSRFILGKNKVIHVALGKTEETSHKTNSYKLTEYLRGDTGLLLTNKTKEEVNQFFESYKPEEFAKAGTISNQTIVLEKGTQTLAGFTHTMEPYFRSLGMNTSLVNTEIVLNEPFVLAEEGKPINVEQSKILKQLGIKLAEFKLNLVCGLTKNGTFFRF